MIKTRDTEEVKELFEIQQAIREEQSTGVQHHDIVTKAITEKAPIEFKAIDLNHLNDLTQQVLLTRYVCNSYLKGKIQYTGSLDLVYMKKSCNIIYYHSIDQTGKANSNGVNFEGLDNLPLHQEAFDFWQECYLQVLGYIQFVDDYNKQLKHMLRYGGIPQNVDVMNIQLLEYSLQDCRQYCKKGLNHFMYLYTNRGGHGAALPKRVLKEEEEEEEKKGVKRPQDNNIIDNFTADTIEVEEDERAEDILKRASVNNCNLNYYDNIFFSDKQVKTIIQAGLNAIKQIYPQIYQYLKLYLEGGSIQYCQDITGDENKNKINTYINRGKQLLKQYIRDNLL